MALPRIILLFLLAVFASVASASAPHHYPPASAARTPPGSAATGHGDAVLRMRRTDHEAEESRSQLVLDPFAATSSMGEQSATPVAWPSAAAAPTPLAAPREAQQFGKRFGSPDVTDRVFPRPQAEARGFACMTASRAPNETAAATAAAEAGGFACTTASRALNEPAAAAAEAGGFACTTASRAINEPAAAAAEAGGFACTTASRALNEPAAAATPPILLKHSRAVTPASAAEVMSYSGEFEEQERRSRMRLAVSLFAAADSWPPARCPARTIALFPAPVAYLQASCGWCSRCCPGYFLTSGLAAVSTTKDSELGPFGLHLHGLSLYGDGIVRAEGRHDVAHAFQALISCAENHCVLVLQLVIVNERRIICIDIIQLVFVPGNLEDCNGGFARDGYSRREIANAGRGDGEIMWAVGPALGLLLCGVFSWYVHDVKSDRTIRLCDSCRGLPAQWVASCCGLKLCSECLADVFLSLHNPDLTDNPCRGVGALGRITEGGRAVMETNMDYYLSSDIIADAEQIPENSVDPPAKIRLREFTCLTDLNARVPPRRKLKIDITEPGGRHFHNSSLIKERDYGHGRPADWDGSKKNKPKRPPSYRLPLREWGEDSETDSD